MKSIVSKVIIASNLGRKNFKATARDFFHITWTRIYLVIFIFLNLIAWILAHLLKINVDQDLIFLHYNIIFGRDWIGQTGMVYLWPLMGLGLIFLNLAVVLGLYKKYKVLTQILLVAAATSNVIIILALYSLYLVNFVSIN